MRRIFPEPDLFRSRQLRHKQARELAMIDRILVANPSAAEAVWKDLEGPLAKTGRRGLSADQVLRAAIAYSGVPDHPIRTNAATLPLKTKSLASLRSGWRVHAGIPGRVRPDWVVGNTGIRIPR